MELLKICQVTQNKLTLVRTTVKQATVNSITLTTDISQIYLEICQMTNIKYDRGKWLTNNASTSSFCSMTAVESIRTHKKNKKQVAQAPQNIR